MTAQSLGGDILDERPRSAAGLWPMLPLAVAFFSLSALVFYHVKQDALQPATLLQTIVVGIYRSVGFVPSFLFFLLVLSWSSIWFFDRLEKPWARLSRLLGFTLALAIWLNLRGDGELAPSHAGAIGAWFAARMVGVFGFVISTLLVGPLAIGAFLMATDFFFYRYIDEVWFARARVATPQRGEVTVDTGVEPAVTEYFKGLASPSPRASGAGFLARAGALMPRAEREEGGSLMAGELDDGAATTAGADAETEVRPLRRERRHRSSWARRSEEPAEPMAAAPDEPFGTEAPRDEPAEPEPMVESAPATVSPWTESVSRATDATGTGGDDWSLGAAVPDHEYDDEETGGLADTNSSGRNAAGNAAGNAATGGAAAEGEPDSASAAGQAQHGIDLPFDPEPAGAGADAADGTGPVRADASASAAGDGDEDDDSLADRLADAELAEDGDEVSDEPVVAIPRPPEGARQRRLFGSSQVDPSLVAEARELVLSTRRASATHLQRKLRVEFEQAMELLSILGRDGVIEIAAGDTQGRVLQ